MKLFNLGNKPGLVVFIVLFAILFTVQIAKSQTEETSPQPADVPQMEGVEVKGILVSGKTGEPAKNTQLQLWEVKSIEKLEGKDIMVKTATENKTTTEEAGGFSLKGVKPGKYIIMATSAETMGELMKGNNVLLIEITSVTKTLDLGKINL